MERRRSVEHVRRNSILLPLIALCAAAVMFGCGRGATSAAASRMPAPVHAQAFGDTARFGLRVVGLDPINETAEARLARSSYVVVLAVRPGRDIELIDPVEHAAPRTQIAGRVSLSMQRFLPPDPDATANADARAQLDYDRCVAEATAKAERAARERGRRTGNSLPAAAQTGHCGKPRPIEKAARRLLAREPAERYLVLLASDNAMSYTDIYEKLGALTVTAPDVATSIEAIAAGLFVGKPGTFAGSFAKW